MASGTHDTKQALTADYARCRSGDVTINISFLDPADATVVSREAHVFRTCLATRTAALPTVAHATHAVSLYALDIVAAGQLRYRRHNT